MYAHSYNVHHYTADRENYHKGKFTNAMINIYSLLLYCCCCCEDSITIFENKCFVTVVIIIWLEFDAHYQWHGMEIYENQLITIGSSAISENNQSFNGGAIQESRNTNKLITTNECDYNVNVTL